MQCNQLEQILEQADGPLPEQAVAHINSCSACRSLTADLEAIRDAAVDMGLEEVSPPERVWISLRHQLEAEGIVRSPRPEIQGPAEGWWFAFQRPAFAGAFLSIVLLAAGLVSYVGESTQVVTHPAFEVKQVASAVPSAESVFNEEALTVGNENLPGFQAQDAAVTDSIRRNLNLVDNFIVMCEKSVREQPENEMAREYLYGAYEQKAELLATATNRSTLGGLQ
jgi:hypothetical protein